MNFKLKPAAQGVIVTLAAIATQNVMAHPSHFEGGSTKMSYTVNKTTGPSTTDLTSNILSRGKSDEWRVGHGTKQHAAETGNFQIGTTGVYEKEIAGISVIYPAGEGATVYKKNKDGSLYIGKCKANTLYNTYVKVDASGNPSPTGTICKVLLDDGMAPWSANTAAGFTDSNHNFYFPDDVAATSSWMIAAKAVGARPSVARIYDAGADGKSIRWIDTGGATHYTFAKTDASGNLLDASGNVIPATKDATGTYTLTAVGTPAEADLFKYQGLATTLADELMRCSNRLPADASGNCVSGLSTGTWEPATTLRGMIKPLGADGYFTRFVSFSGIDGFSAINPRKSSDPLKPFADVDYSQTSLPGKTGIGIHIAQTGQLKFSDTSCARRLVIRPAGIDASYSADGKLAKTIDGEHMNNWMGGRTARYQAGADGQQNNWSASITLLNRDTTKQPYPGTCTDKTNGDYDLVVMTTKYEIDTYLSIPGIKNSR